MGSPADRLRRRISRDGPVSFHDFMEEALYGEGGYYSRAEPPVGRDFATGSSLSPLFGRATARVLRRGGDVAGWRHYLEVGYGGGEHLEAVAATLGDEGFAGRLLAWDRVARRVPRGVERLGSLDRLAAGELTGLIFSYELFDAMPVHRLVGRAGGGLGELWVDVDDRGFRWREGELSAPELADLVAGVELEAGQIADVAPEGADLYGRIAALLGSGLVVTCDYGFDRPRLFDARIRRHGTLACYRRHRVHRDPFSDVGEQDLTAHVDFSALATAGEAAGLRTLCLTRQARWLLAAGIFDDLADADAASRAAARALLDGDGMGEEIRVLVQAKSCEAGRILDLTMLGRSGLESP